MCHLWFKKVPARTKEKYEAAEGWKNFANIVEKDDMGIDAVDAQSDSSADAPILLDNLLDMVDYQFYDE